MFLVLFGCAGLLPMCMVPSKSAGATSLRYPKTVQKFGLGMYVANTWWSFALRIKTYYCRRIALYVQRRNNLSVRLRS